MGARARVIEYKNLVINRYSVQLLRKFKVKKKNFNLQKHNLQFKKINLLK